jgi:hypothetical protein
MTTRSTKKKNRQLDDQNWASNYLESGEKVKIDEAAFIIGYPTSKQDINFDDLQDLCLNVCKQLGMNDERWLMFLSDDSFHEEKKFQGIKNYMDKLIRDQDETPRFPPAEAINGKKSKK